MTTKTIIDRAIADDNEITDDGMMCVWRDNTEISHYLMSHINDQDNMERWQVEICMVGAETIDRLRAEVIRLRKIIAQQGAGNDNESHY